MTIIFIGGFCGYFLTLLMYAIGKILFPFTPKFSMGLISWTEKIYTLSIRSLLVMQPWLRCKSNIPSLFQIKQYYQNNCKTKRILYVANHRSNLDTFLMISWIPGLRGLAKSSLYYNIILAPFMWLTGFIPVKKGNPVSYIEGLHKLRYRLIENEIPVLIFPENTRCKKGTPKLNKWSQSVFKMALDAKATVIPIALKNTDGILGKGDFLLNPFEPIEVKMLQPIEASSYKNFQVLSKDVHFILEQELS